MAGGSAHLGPLHGARLGTSSKIQGEARGIMSKLSKVTMEFPMDLVDTLLIVDLGDVISWVLRVMD